ncbi:hypothetical protein HHJ78_10985 [Mobiluncus mulieris]|uniref:Uncharacterized protein n=1 Tax=Mobiluncus mulieris TaxID=2052 RepID=A0A7Y0U324_9ACTO|nr:hypothetical protein [Mobiluncus mulieris]NMW66009.1 hypothetical protein [Mobiluncus mulieris]
MKTLSLHELLDQWLNEHDYRARLDQGLPEVTEHQKDIARIYCYGGTHIYMCPWRLARTAGTPPRYYLDCKANGLGTYDMTDEIDAAERLIKIEGEHIPATDMRPGDIIATTSGKAFSYQSEPWGQQILIFVEWFASDYTTAPLAHFQNYRGKSIAAEMPDSYSFIRLGQVMEAAR